MIQILTLTAFEVNSFTLQIENSLFLQQNFVIRNQLSQKWKNIQSSSLNIRNLPIKMRRNLQTSYDTLPRSSSNSRSRSQNHYFIQANQFQKRYQNSLFNAYKLNTSRKCPPCCNNEGQFQSQMTFRDRQGQKYKDGTELHNDYYQNSYAYNKSHKINHQSHSINNRSHLANQVPSNQAMTNLHNSKRYLQDLLQKNKTNFKIHKQKAQNQISSLQKMLQTKNQQIHQLNKQIQRLKKISLQGGSTYVNNQSYIKQDQNSLIELQNKQQTIKELERKINRLRQENSYFRQDLQIKNKQIQQLKVKYRLKQENDIKIKQQLQRQILIIKQQKKSIIEKVLLMEKMRDQDQRQIQTEKQSKKLLSRQLDQLNYKFNQYKKGTQMNIAKNNQKIKSYEYQFKTIKQMTHSKDMKIQGLISRITCIQSEIDFFKDKFTNLLMQIQREERQSATIYQKAQSLRQNGERLYEQIQKIRQSQIIQQLESHKASKINGYNMFDPVEHRMFQSHVYKKKDWGKQTIFQNLQNKQDYMLQSGHEIIHKFPSLNMSISPIRYKQ